MLERVNKEQICCPVVFFEEIWGGKYPAGPRASCFAFPRQMRYFFLNNHTTKLGMKDLLKDQQG